MQQYSSCGIIGAREWRRARVSVVLATLGLLLGVLNSLNAQSLTWLGTLGGNRSEAYGVSDGGSVVVGRSYNPQNKYYAFRWTATGGMQNLGTLPQFTRAEAYGVSGDGNRVVGVAIYEIPYGGAKRAFL